MDSLLSKITNLPIIIIGLMLTLGFLVYSPTVGAINTDGVCEGIGFTGANCDDPADPQDGDAQNQINTVIGTVINILSILVGVASVIMVIIGGFKYITSAGDANSAKSAKDTILYAIIGLVIVALAQVIVRFVLFNISTSP